MSEKKCAYCDSKESLTRDHIIPKWLFLRSHMFGLKRHKELKKSGFASVYQTLCGNCNSEKGGLIDYTIPQVRTYMTLIRDSIDRNLNETA